jgi:hypothetical protein
VLAAIVATYEIKIIPLHCMHRFVQKYIVTMNR